MLVDDSSLTPQERHLRDLMSEISEACWYASWEIETEFQVWRLATEGGAWGRGKSADLSRTLDEISALANQLGRWIVWLEGRKRPSTWRSGRVSTPTGHLDTLSEAWEEAALAGARDKL